MWLFIFSSFDYIVFEIYEIYHINLLKSIITRTSEYTRVIVISELNFTLLNQDCRLFSATFLPDFCNFNGIKCFLCIDLLGCALKLSLFLEFILLQTIFPYFHGIENAKLEFRPEYLDFV